MSLKKQKQQTENEEQELKTNGFLVRFVGTNQIPDSFLHKLLFVVLFPVQVFMILRACYVRESYKTALYNFLNMYSNEAKRTTEVEIETVKKPMKIVFISDTHNSHKQFGELPEGDVLIHTGDFSNWGTMKEVKNFANWFSSQPHKTKILVPGNHDMIMDKEYYDRYYKDWTPDGKKRSTSEALEYFKSKEIQVLIDEGTTVDGLRLYGSPWVRQYASWQTAFNKKEKDILQYWERLEPADILLTHQPPKGFGDRDGTSKAVGCQHLLDKVVNQVKPRLHVFGHEHLDVGIFENDSITFINAASVDNFYRVRKPIVVDILPTK
eukprot:CAMPEP_0204874028 /NCGR_PEP_ID=MMETSP1348-20121228/42274_1 /ASSEMBLY_ACC=CAM_ASM_000700 /TAXON_ID=215587 /ORGANISM="Aplanochytrium stocchinoi, Strain GSBS06" /LENGTH=322 /DNA_ID=CAMNT_0052029661 /DNA_START=136 /DNA_END=1104 /DNA_ORIENTATION=-